MITLTCYEYKVLEAFGRQLTVSCKARNLENGLRPRSWIVHTTTENGTEGVPYSPQEFPRGTWEVYKPEAVEPEKDADGYLGPWIIRTNARQLVYEWETEQEERRVYTLRTPRQVWDWGYLIHFSNSEWTLGCLKMEHREDILWLAPRLTEAIDGGDLVRLTV